MAVTAIGFTGTVFEAGWASMIRMAMLAGGKEVVDDGTDLTPAVATGTDRRVSVAAGSAMAAGILVTNSASLNVSLAVNGSGNPRIDYVVVNINYTTDTATITSVTGAPNASPQPPALTRNAGTLWQIPLAKVTVNPGATQLGGGTVEDVRPQRRRAYSYTTSDGARNYTVGATDVTGLTLAIPDPGWDHILYCSAQSEYATSSAGSARNSIQVDGVELMASTNSPNNVDPVVIPGRGTGSQTGKHTIRLGVTARNMPGEQLAQLTARLNVLLVPA